MQKPASVEPAIVPVVRVLRLKRRRTNVPWIYSLYHADPRPRRRRARVPWEVAEAMVEEMVEEEVAELEDGDGEWATDSGDFRVGPG
jgi:hypothetical protein